MAELHVVGQVLGGSGFQLDNLFCKWFIETGSNFRLLQGLTGGQTHCDYPNADEAAVWGHPIDVHWTLKGIDGWPRLQVEVWGVDQFGRCELGEHSPGLPTVRAQACSELGGVDRSLASGRGVSATGARSSRQVVLPHAEWRTDWLSPCSGCSGVWVLHCANESGGASTHCPHMAAVRHNARADHM
mmetsp:Transcript_6196/g.20320  ORF Transcript_6196/g.20320 Transcript_6196/m.20320 type:complete len:186 (+) Transcript_6196:33-590(+)